MKRIYSETQRGNWFLLTAGNSGAQRKQAIGLGDEAS